MMVRNGTGAPRWRRRGRKFGECEQDGRDHRQDDQAEIGRQEGHRRQQHVGALDDLRADDGGQDAAGHHQGNGAGTGLGVGDLGGGEAEVLRDAEAEAGKGGADTVDLEIAAPDGEGEDQAAEQGAGAAEIEAGLAAEAGEHDAGRDGGGHGRGHLDRHRQRIQRLVDGECVADQRAHHGLAGCHGVHCRQAAEQEPDVAVHRNPVAASDASPPNRLFHPRLGNGQFNNVAGRAMPELKQTPQQGGTPSHAWHIIP